MKMVTARELMGLGGEWLKVAREWVQRYKLNGSDVTWGSNDVLRPSMTIKEVEELAAEVAASVINNISEGKVGLGLSDRECAIIKAALRLNKINAEYKFVPDYELLKCTGLNMEDARKVRDKVQELDVVTAGFTGQGGRDYEKGKAVKAGFKMGEYYTVTSF